MKPAPGSAAFWRRRLVVPALALLGLNVLVALVYTLPQVTRERNATARAQSLRAQVERERQSAAALDRWAATLNRNADDTKRFYADVVGTRSQRLVPVLKEIEKVARDLGVAAGAVTYAPVPVKDVPLVRFEIRMPVSGAYPQLVAFLDQMERSRQFLIVDKVALREKAESGADLTIELSTYFRDEGAGGGSRGR